MIAENVSSNSGRVSIVQRKGSARELLNNLSWKTGELGDAEERGNGSRTVPLLFVPSRKPQVEIVQADILWQGLIQHLEVPIESDCLFYLISLYRFAEITDDPLNRLILQSLELGN